MTWRLVPETIGIVDRKSGTFVRAAPVLRVVAHPPGKHPPEIPIGRDWYAVEIITAYGTRWQGFKNARITSSLRMAVDTTGRERDEVLARWEAVEAPL